MKNPRVDEYIEKAQPFAQPILKHIREVIHKAYPEIEETIKWGMPCFNHQGTICSMSAFKEHCAFGFFKQSLMPDFQKYLKEHEINTDSAMGTWGRLTKVENLPPDEKIIAWVREGAQLNEKGINLPRPAKRKKYTMPDYFKHALDSNEVTDAYNSRPPYQQNDYIGWITDAKQEETRTKRIEQMIDELKKGNVYMKMKWGGGK